jgi:DNA polymerase IV
MRRIVHLDMDAFYASVEQRDDPALRGRPVVVGGRPDQRGVVAAASYEARTFGVRSAMPMARAVRLCPELVIVHPDFERYRQVSRQVMDLLRACTPLVEPLSLDEAYLDVTENNWNEPLATNVAKRLKREIRETTQLTASAGVAPNKFLAKIASGYRKPDGLTVIPPERVEAFLQDLPVEALWGVGPVTARKLRAAGIEKLVQIRTVDLEKLRTTVGSLADWLLQLSHGDDPRAVVPDRASKSSSTENTYAEDLVELEAIRAELDRMARENAEWLTRRRLEARTVTIKVRYADFTTVTRSHTLSRATSDADVIASWAKDLVERTDAGQRPVRLLGVRVQGLVEQGTG